MPALDKLRHEIAPDNARRPGDQDPHRLHLRGGSLLSTTRDEIAVSRVTGPATFHVRVDEPMANLVHRMCRHVLGWRGARRSGPGERRPGRVTRTQASSPRGAHAHESRDDRPIAALDGAGRGRPGPAHHHSSSRRHRRRVGRCDRGPRRGAIRQGHTARRDLTRGVRSCPRERGATSSDSSRPTRSRLDPRSLQTLRRAARAFSAPGRPALQPVGAIPIRVRSLALDDRRVRVRRDGR